MVELAADSNVTGFRALPSNRFLDTTEQLAYGCVTTAADMLGAAKYYFILFGILTIIGGVIGYASKGSVPSIVAGTISGVLLLVAAILLPGNITAGLVIALIVSILLAGRFVPAFLKTGNAMPAGMMSFLSLVGIVFAIVAWVKR
jgi:uncharacterized membrane protein (UPF0136 family)